jgi:hypothetical protein
MIDRQALVHQLNCQYLMIWTQKVHIGMMKSLHQEVNGLNALLAEIVLTEQTSNVRFANRTMSY